MTMRLIASDGEAWPSVVLADSDNVRTSPIALRSEVSSPRLLAPDPRPDAESKLAPLRSVTASSALLREIAPQFGRSDVSAQLLRVRLIAHHLGALPLDETAAREEAQRTAAFHIVAEADPRRSGGFWFGRRAGVMLPFVNPVSAAFALQALTLWQDHLAGRWRFELHQLI
jgi:hypothetical protein